MKRERTTWIMDDKLVAAQAFLFFAAGFETSASATSYTLHLLAQHQEAQERARAEVLVALERHNGVITYEAINEMTYLSWALKESMRLVPPAGNIHRQVTRPCYLPGVGLLEPGVRVIMSACSFHRDPGISRNRMNSALNGSIRTTLHRKLNLRIYHLVWDHGLALVSTYTRCT